MPDVLHKRVLEEAPKVRDPHHGGLNEWAYYKREYYHRTGLNKWWSRAKKMQLTPARVLALASITPED